MRNSRGRVFLLDDEHGCAPVTLVAGPNSSLSVTLSDTRVYEPQIRARLETTAQARALTQWVYFHLTVCWNRNDKIPTISSPIIDLRQETQTLLILSPGRCCAQVLSGGISTGLEAISGESVRGLEPFPDMRCGLEPERRSPGRC